MAKDLKHHIVIGRYHAHMVHEHLTGAYWTDDPRFLTDEALESFEKLSLAIADINEIIASQPAKQEAA